MNELKAKVYRALELQKQIGEINAEIYKLLDEIKRLEKQKVEPAKELNEIMKDDYIYDKVYGLRMGGIL